MPLDSKRRWKRLRMGGPLAVADRMQLYPLHRLDQLRGVQFLSVCGQRQAGYPKSNIAVKAALVTINALKTFPNDREIIAPAISTLGWCLRGPGERKVRQACLQNGTVEMVIEYMERFRCDSRIINAIVWMRGGMPKYLPPLPEIVVPVEIKNGDSESEESDDEEGELKKEPKSIDAPKVMAPTTTGTISAQTEGQKSSPSKPSASAGKKPQKQ